MNENPSTSEQWEPCPPGELQRVAAGLRRRRRGERLAKAAGLVGASAVLLLIGGLAVQPLLDSRPGPWLYGGISCPEVQANLRSYVAGQLEPPLTERMRSHLEQCPECGPRLRHMTTDTKNSIGFRHRDGLELVCRCGACEGSWSASGPARLNGSKQAIW